MVLLSQVEKNENLCGTGLPIVCSCCGLHCWARLPDLEVSLLDTDRIVVVPNVAVVDMNVATCYVEACKDVVSMSKTIINIKRDVDEL